MMGRMVRPALVAPEGTFTLQNVSPDKYRVSASWGPVYIKSIRIGDTQFEGDVLDLRGGIAGGALTVVVSSAVGQVSGTVTDINGPVSGAVIALVATNPDLNRFHFAVPRPDGTYSFRNVIPGSYKLALVELDEMNLVGRGKGLQESAATASDIDIQPGDKITKDLTK
jgi:hypothetical protein